MIRIPRPSRGRVLLPASALVPLPAAAPAAQTTGTISGTVIDNTSQVVPRATVTWIWALIFTL